MGILISGALYVYGDNISVIHTTSKPESTLKKNCDSIAYHAFHESVATEEPLRGHRGSQYYPSDLSTKIITGPKQKHLVSLKLYDIYDGDT